ncbi:hypothetical protein ALO_06125 [Acetonema longum DSM 6540]|uniref:Uncharacterized protein n=1 Tax=Acetonema longum DSM 6540 TaxID=1009370 RepID=F7NGN7_9FIRM|nr:hypothetical protein ALO_06125 [Acetonema longum DSM 6540]
MEVLKVRMEVVEMMLPAFTGRLPGEFGIAFVIECSAVIIQIGGDLGLGLSGQ